MSATIVLTPDLVQGERISSAVAWPAGMSTVTATGLLSNQDIAAATNALNSFAIDVSFDGGKTFQQGNNTPWVGNTLDRSGNPVPPSTNLSYDVAHLPTHVQVRIDSPGTLSIGASVEFSA